MTAWPAAGIQGATATSRAPLILVLASLLGCGSGLSHVQGGYAHAIAKSPAESALAVESHATLIQGPVAAVAGPFAAIYGRGDPSGFKHTAHFGVGGIARGKLGANVRQIALGPTLYLADGDARGALGFYMLSTYHLVQLEWLGPESRFAFGMFSPVLQGGVVIRPIWTTLSVSGEYDVRFSSAPNTGYVAFLLGVGRLRYD